MVRPRPDQPDRLLRPCGMYVEREYWWWNGDVQKAVKEKRDSFKKWQSSRTTAEYLADYRENRTNAKKAVTTAKDEGYNFFMRNCIPNLTVEKDKT